MNRLEIEPGEKYALIAVPQVALEWPSNPETIELGDGIWFAKGLPFHLAAHWQEWIGSIRAKQLIGADLCICVKAKCRVPESLDDENQTLLGRVGRIFQGLQLAAPLRCGGEIEQLTGAHGEDGIDVRQVATLPSPVHSGVNVSHRPGLEAFRLAVRLGPILSSFPTGKYVRLCRVLNAFFLGIRQADIRERLHQFCRCVEGLLLTEPGKTTRQFKSRTELFVGPQQHELMGAIYDNRSAVEHMGEPVLSETDERVRRKRFVEFAVFCEELARYCVVNALLMEALRPYFEDDATLAAFWAMPKAQRETIWGARFDVTRCLESTRATELSNEQLGMPETN